jgi:hypothetical protein
MVPAERAPVGLKEPEERSFNGVSGPDTSKINRSAVWTARAEQPHGEIDHHWPPTFVVRFEDATSGWREST